MFHNDRHAAGSAPADDVNPRPHPDFARHIVRLFQCRLCAAPYKHVVSLPCGRSICRTCLPQSFVRNWVTYPPVPNRDEAIQCPIKDCGRTHAVVDCSSDVILNKLATLVHAAIELEWAEAARLNLTTSIHIQESHSKAPIQSYEPIVGTRLLATWFSAAQGRLRYDADAIVYEQPASATTARIQADECDINVLETLQQTMRGEMDCQICYCLLYDPLTTPCGHTFCRHCLLFAFRRSRFCPSCRRSLGLDPSLKAGPTPSNERIIGLTRTFWKDELDAREEAYVAEGIAKRHLIDIPLFVYNLSFPGMPMYFVIFEPQYRRMLQNALDTDGRFGMVMPRDPNRLGDGFFPVGILLQIKTSSRIPDGRSIVELVGIHRFRVLNYYMKEGYMVGVSERAEDVGVEQEEAMEAAEVGYDASDSAAGSYVYNFFDTRDEESAASAPFWTSWRQFGSDMPESPMDLNVMTTESLMRFAMSFVDRTVEKKLPWLNDDILFTYGTCPEDPALFPWWFGSTLPISKSQKVRLISAFTVRDRLKICGSWILEMKRRTR